MLRFLFLFLFLFGLYDFWMWPSNFGTRPLHLPFPYKSFFLSYLMTGYDAPHACNADYRYMELKLDVISVQ